MKVFEITAAQAKLSGRLFKIHGRHAPDDGRAQYNLGSGYYATESDAYDFDTGTNYFYIYQLMDSERLGTITISNFICHEVLVEIISLNGEFIFETKDDYEDYVDIEDALPFVKQTLKKFRKEGRIE